MNRSKSPGEGWEALVETCTPRNEGASIEALLIDEIDNFRMSREEHPVDGLLRMKSFQRKILSSIRTWSDWPDALVRTKLVNALPEKYDFQKKLLKS